MTFALARSAGVFALCCCTTSHAYAQRTEVPAAEIAADAGADGRVVDIYNFRIEGNTVLPRMAVEKAVMPFLGPKRPIGDVEAARAALEKAYRAEGYETVAVELPEQEVKGGVFRFNVVETRIGRVRVTEARYFSPKDIKKSLPALAEGSVPNYKAVSREIAAANKSGDRLIMPTLRAGDTPGEVDIDLAVEDSAPYHGSFEINDRSSSRTERLRASASVRYTNLFQLGHSLSLQGQMTPTKPDQSYVLSGSYVAPIGGEGFSLLGYVVRSNSDVAAIGGIGVLGTGTIVGLRGLYSFTSGAGASQLVHQFTAGIDYKNFEENLILGADTASTPIDYYPITAQYSLARRTDRDELDLSLGVNAGLRGLGAGDRGFGLKRFNASANWVSLRSELSYLYKYPGDWRAGIKLSGQIAGGPLISNEQFSAGGLDSVRGYFESQELGDDGATMQFQIDSPSFSDGVKWMNEMRVFGFVDAGILHVRDALQSQQSVTNLLSVGAGLRFRAFKYFNASTLLAAPLRNEDGLPMDVGDRLRAQVRFWAEF